MAQVFSVALARAYRNQQRQGKGGTDFDENIFTPL
jgi:hypothetical protein